MFHSLCCQLLRGVILLSKTFTQAKSLAVIGALSLGTAVIAAPSAYASVPTCSGRLIINAANTSVTVDQVVCDTGRQIAALAMTRRNSDGASVRRVGQWVGSGGTSIATVLANHTLQFGERILS